MSTMERVMFALYCSYLGIGLLIYILCWIFGAARMRAAGPVKSFWALIDCLTAWPIGVVYAWRRTRRGGV